MKFNSVIIKNFRNFEDISIDLTNKNVFFGMNDVGKTNFLYALRFVFDKDIRKQNFSDTDYYKKKVDVPIEIVIAIDISDTENADSQKLRAKLKGAILSEQDIVYIKVKSDYDEKEMIGVPVLYWGGNVEDLEEMKVHGTFFEIDYVFNVIYIDAYVDLYTLFKKNANKLLVNDKDRDKDILDNIRKTCDELNIQISGLSGIKAFEEKIAPEYKKFRHDDISVSVKSEIAVKGLYSNIVPYIKQDTDDSLYPTSGEGRKKLLVYAIFDLLSQDEEEKKINIFLIEEPENHLHRSMQIALSHILFLDDKYQYLFMTTHSPYVLAEMDQVNLVRIYNEDKIVSRSVLYAVPAKFKSQELIRLMAEHMGKEANTTFEEIKKYVIHTRFSHQIESQICQSVVAQIKYKLSCVDISKQNSEKAKASLETAFKSINYEQVSSNETEKFQKILSEQNYADVIKVFNEKGIAKSIGQYFNIDNSSYCTTVISLLNGSKHNDIVAALLPYFPTEIPR